MKRLSSSPVFASVGVVLVNWNTPECTIACIGSLEKSTVAPRKILVIDNCSSDGSADRIARACPNAEVIQLTKNTGFTGGNNAGVRRLLDEGFEFVWILNNDTEVEPNCMSGLLNALIADPEVGAATGKILRYDDKTVIWYAGAIEFPNRLTCRHKGSNKKDIGQFAVAADVPFLSGCCMLVRTSVLQKVGMFDDRFFAYYEDLDWCFRARKLGVRLRYVPDAILWHKVSFTTKQILRAGEGTASPTQMYLHVRNRLLIVAKHASTSMQTFLATGDILAYACHCLLGFLVKRRWRKMWAVLRGVADGFRSWHLKSS